MAHRLDRGTLTELMIVLAAGALFAVLFATTYTEPAPPMTLTLDPAAEGVEEHWSGIYVGEQKIGTAISRSSATPDGGHLLQDRTQMKLKLLGQTNDLTLASDVRLAPDGGVATLLAQVKTEVKGLPVTLRAEGKRTNNGMELELYQAGLKLTTLELDEVPATPTTIYRSVIDGEPSVGKRLSVPWFSPLSLGRAEAHITVLERIDAPTPEGATTPAWRLQVEHSGQVVEAIVSDDGRRLQEREVEGGLGMRVVAETREVALNEGWPAEGEAAVDLIALSSVPVDRKLPGGGRSLQRLVLKVDGPDTVSELLSRFHGERWDPVTGHLTIEIPQPTDAGLYPLPNTDRAMHPWTRSTTFAPSDNRSIIRAAGQVVGDELLANQAGRKLNHWVYSNLEKVPVAGVPHAVEVLTSRRGDCNEHTTLYTAMARSLGLPTRMAAGIVYSESIFEDGAFYYHAWPEIWLGDAWVPTDPTFGQFPADATHVKLVEGELDKQMELMGVIGRLKLEIVDDGTG
jgi:transglutaminase-like putative cysteine protease